MSGLPSGWRGARLDEVAEVRLGRQRSPKNHAGPRMRPYLRAANVRWEGLDLSDVKEMNFSETESATYELRSGDVLVVEASGSADEVGKPAVFRGEIEGCCFQNTLIRVRSRGPQPEFLRYFLLREALAGRIGRASPGVGIHHIGAARLAAWRLPIPPDDQQGRIVEAIEEQLSRLDAAVESIHRVERNLERLRDAALHDALANLPTSRLGGLLREPLRNGKSIKASPQGDIRVLTLTAVSESDFSDRNTKLVEVSPTAVQDLWLEPGDIFIERSNTAELVGTAARYDGPAHWAIFPDLLIRVRTTSALDPRFAELALQTPALRRYFQSRAKGIAGSMPKVDQTAVLEAPVPFVSLEEQRRILAAVDHQFSILDATRSAVNVSLRRGKTLREAILREAFAGGLVTQDPTHEPASDLLAESRPAQARA